MQRVLLSALLILVLAGLAGLVVFVPPEEATLTDGPESGVAAPALEGSGDAAQADGSGANVASGETLPGVPSPGEMVAGGGTTVVPQGTEGGNSASAPADPGAPTFDVVRVEPSGEALIAGVAEPNAEVEVLSNGEVVAEATADPSGAFIAMPVSPLEPGEHLLTLRRAGDASAEPEQEVAVVVPQDGGGVASVAPVAPIAPAEQQVAAAPDSLASSGAPESATSLDAGAPTFGAVDVKPGGETVVAGFAEPNAEVEVLSNGEVVAEATADPSGAFIAMPTTPLEPGEHVLTLRRAGDTSAEPEQEVAVLVPQDGGGVASVAPVAPAEPQIAAAPDASASPGVTGPVASLDAGAPTFGAVEVEPDGEAVIAGFAEPNADVEVLSGGEVVAEATADTAGAFTATPALPLEPGDHVLTLRRAGDASAEPEQEVAVVVPQDGGGVASVAPVASAEPRVAAVLDAPAFQGVPGPVASLDAGAPPSGPTAGAGPEAAASAQEQAVTSAGQSGVPQSGAGGSAGETGAGQADELIASAPPAASADAAAGTAAGSPGTTSPGQASPGQPAGDMAAADASDAAPPATPGETPLSVAAAEAEGSSVYVAGQAEPGSSVRVFANEDLLGEAQVNASGNWMLEAKGSIPVGRVEIRADQTAGQNVVARTVTPFVRYPGYTPLIPNADTAAGLPASLDAATDIPIPANVIIRSGDNLWTISRRTYGHGIRYKSIYSANTDLIRNPDLIYPGQVFLLPTQRDGAAEPPLTQ